LRIASLSDGEAALVAKHLGPLLDGTANRSKFCAKRIEARDGVIFFDVSDLDLEGYTNSFRTCCTRNVCIP